MENKSLKLTREQVREKLVSAIKNGKTEDYLQSLEELVQVIDSENKAEYEQAIKQKNAENDAVVLAQRGVRQLTSHEKDYYNALAVAMNSENPKQALTNIDVVMPQTIFESVFENLRKLHPLLSKINFVNAGAAIKMIVSENSDPIGAWGELDATIVKELTASFKAIETNLYKLSAFLPVAKSSLDLGPEWLDRFVREYLYESCANGLEYAAIDGTGKSMPIGMNRSIYDGVAVSSGVYPKKAEITVSCFDIETVGNLFDMLSVDGAGKPRTINADDVILVVNPRDYYKKVRKATMILNTSGKYEFVIDSIKPENVITSPYVARNKALFGIASRYDMFFNSAKEGKIEYSDQSHFLEDRRDYIIKAYANGRAKDDNAFLYLDITNLTAPLPEVISGSAPSASEDDDLVALSLGRAVFNTPFAKGTTSYTATTTDASNILKAVPSDSKATLLCKLGNTVIENGEPIVWASGSNTVTVKVTAEDGTHNTTYTVTVTKS